MWDSKRFIPEVRFETNFVSSANHPKDHAMGESAEIIRSNGIQLEPISAKVPFDASDAGVVPRCPNSEHPQE